MPTYRAAPNTYAIQQVGGFDTGPIGNTANAVRGDGFFGPPTLTVISPTTSGIIHGAQAEVTSDRAAELSWAELELPLAPRRAEVSWAELEVPLGPRRAEVSWAEFEVPLAPRRGEVSWAELELPLAPGSGGGHRTLMHIGA